MSRWSCWGLGGALAFGLLAAQARAGEAKTVPTYHKDVARILQKSCQDCHRPGQVAPFALLTYEQARKRSGDLSHVTTERQMPPWPAAREYGGPFRDERVLSDAEVATLKAWADAGAPEGDAKDGPIPRTFSSAWALGAPDVVLTMPEPYALPASGDDEFRVFVLKTDLSEDRWIKAVDFQPGNRKVVHHVIAAVDSSGVARERDAKDPKPGYVAVGGFGEGVPISAFLPIWTPGSKPHATPEGAGYFLPKGADILIQLHYHKNGKAELDATSIGLYLADKPLPKRVNTGFVFPTIPPLKMIALSQKFRDAQKKNSRRPDLTEMMRDVLVIPAGEPNYEVLGSTGSGISGRPLSRDILVTAVMPHMHWRGKDFDLWAVLPDGKKTKVPLIKINHWNFNWQGTYAFQEPVRLPKGAWLELAAHFDNSADNPQNPSKPPKLVTWGDQSQDEMCLGIFEFVNVEDDGPSQRKGALR